MSQELAIICGVAGLVSTICSILFAIRTYYRNKSIDESEVNVRLAKIETDVLYIRQNIAKREKWEAAIEKRLRQLEKKV